MKKRMKLFLATIVSWFMVIATVSPTFAYSTNDVTNAQAVALNQPATSYLESNDALKSFSFDIPADGYFNVNVKPSANTNSDDVNDGWSVEIYKADPMQKILSGSARNEYTSLDYGTGAGKYYVVVTANDTDESDAPVNADFDLKVNYQASSIWEKEDNNTTALANPISLNTVYTGDLYSIDDTDWYAFDITGRGYINLSIKPDASEDLDHLDSGWDLNLYNATGEKVNSYGGVKNFVSENIPLMTGHYYLQVSENKYSDNSNGFKYNLGVNFTAADDWEIEPNDVSSQATAIDLNKTYHGLTYSDDNTDWYAFTLAYDSKIGFTFTQNASANLDDLGDGWDVKLKDATNDYISLENVTSMKYKEVNLKAGTYYINVQGDKYYGPGTTIYDFTVSLLSQKTPQVQPSASTPAPAVTNNPAQTATNTPASTSMPAVKKTQTTKPAPAVTKTSATKTKKTQPKKKTVNKKLKLGKAAIKKAKAGRKAINVSWKKVNKAKSYQISYKDVKSKKWITKSTKKLSYSIKKLRSKKKYSVRVRAVSGKTAGSWSKVKTLRVR